MRAPQEQLDALAQWARIHDRSQAEELRLAVGLLLREHALNHLSHPAGRADVEAQGLDPDEEQRMLKRSLREFRARVFRRPESPAATLRFVHDEPTEAKP